MNEINSAAENNNIKSLETVKKKRREVTYKVYCIFNRINNRK